MVTSIMDGRPHPRGKGLAEVKVERESVFSYKRAFLAEEFLVKIETLLGKRSLIINCNRRATTRNMTENFFSL